MAGSFAGICVDDLGFGLVHEVFAYATDVSKVPEWQTSALEARVDGTMQPGATGAIVRKFLGRRMESSVQFDEYEPPRKFALHATSGPVRFRVQQTYEPTGEGARITVVMEGEPGGFFKLAEPLVQRAIHREMEANFATLKDILESGSA
jgi:Polyketide cyclase / dehydrase and lipid transport